MNVPHSLRLVVVFLLVGSAASVAEAQLFRRRRLRTPPPAPAAEPAPFRGFLVGEPITHGNLTIFPVSTVTAKNDDRFITLDEAIKAGTVEIYEKGAGTPGGPALPQSGAAPAAQPPQEAPNRPCEEEEQPAAQEPRAQTDRQAQQQREEGYQQSLQQSAVAGGNEVNSLFVVNKSDRPLYLMPGEIIIGGSQDRVIGIELVIAPDKKPVAIDVFCVEHGRWGSRGVAEYGNILSQSQANAARANSVTLADGAAAPATAAKQAAEGKFVGSIGSLSKAGRVAVQASKEQGKVWEEVGKTNAQGKVKAQSGTFAGNYGEEEAVKRLDPYLEQLQEPIAKTPNVVGIIVAVNGKVESMDVFESTPLFRKLWPKLLKSFALDAANAQDAKLAKVATRGEAIAFMNDVAKAGAKSTENRGNLALAQGESERVLLFSAHDKRVESGAAAAMPSVGGFGGGIHGSAFSK